MVTRFNHPPIFDDILAKADGILQHTAKIDL